LSDYNAALAIDADHVTSLYGRGLVKLKKGDDQGGNSDIKRAKELRPTIVEEFKKYGITW
jgi:hypothetical protein